MTIQLRMSVGHWDRLRTHLFPGDGDEHGAVIAAAVQETAAGLRLLTHELFLAEDGINYVPGERGYRMLTAAFVMDCVLECADLQMAYLAVHCHGGTDTVDFSGTDMASHERGYPALRDIIDGLPVGGLVFAQHAVAGDIWLPEDTRQELDVLVVAGQPIDELHSEPLQPASVVDPTYDRQVRLFGDRGQELLSRAKVGVIGAGGAGSMVLEQLARLGVGQVVLVDPDRLELSNRTRVVGSGRWDAFPAFADPRLIRLNKVLSRFNRHKVEIAKRAMRRANVAVKITTHAQNVIDIEPVRDLIDCDYLLLAADSMQARHVFNAIVHQYLIPGGQMGAKAQVDQTSGELLDLFVVYRRVRPGTGCLWCNGLILADRLQEEATNPAQLHRQRYVDDEQVPAPSVITLNGIAASLAMTDLLMAMTGLAQPAEITWTRYYPRTDEFIEEIPRTDPACIECSEEGRLGRGDTKRLPIRQRG